MQRLCIYLYPPYLAYEDSKGEMRVRGKDKNNSKAGVGNMKYDYKRENEENEGLTSAKYLTK